MAPRTPQKIGVKGSLAWMQRLVNERPDQLSAAVGAAIKVEPRSIIWVSPLASDEYAEYCDQGFLNKLGINLARRPLPAFWPTGGPQWSALGRSGAKFILVETKSHLSELTSSCPAGETSLAKIQRAFEIVKMGIGADANAKWIEPHYQYASRLAHLFLLRELNGIDAELVVLCFVNDHVMGGPPSSDHWLLAFDQVHYRLGIPQYWILEHVHHVFIDVNEITQTV
jgi:hypothetical protein